MITRWRVDCQRPTNTLLLLVSTWAATGILLGAWLVATHQTWARPATTAAAATSSDTPALIDSAFAVAPGAAVSTPPPADLVITQTDSVDPVRPGSIYTYTVGITNTGPGAATFVALMNDLPAAATVLAVAPTQGSCRTRPPITCELGTLAANTGVTVTLAVQPDAQGTFSNVASVIADEPDPNAANNVMTETTKVSAIRYLPGFEQLALTPGIDSSNFVTTGFTLQLFGGSYTGLFVNDNGNVTFNRDYRSIPDLGLDAASRIILAPFAADVDMRGDNSQPVTYGWDTVDGRQAIGVNWVQVGYFDGLDGGDDKRNSFQLVLIDRADVSAGAFDVEFNYEQIEWETGADQEGVGGRGGRPARAGYANRVSTPEHLFEIPGSGVPGAFLDSNASGLIYRNQGTYRFQVRNGVFLPDLRVTKTASAHPVQVGRLLTYTVTIANQGGGHAPGTVLTDTLPTAVDFITATATQGVCALPDADGQVVCSLGMVKASEAAEVTVVVQAPAMPQDIINRAVVTSMRQDVAAGDNATELRTRVGRAVRLRLGKQVTPDPVVAGQVLTYTIVMTNDGAVTATGVSLIEALAPEISSLGSSSSTGLACSVTGQTVACPVGSLPVSGTAFFTITGLLDRAARDTISSMASIQSRDANEAAPGDQRITLITPVVVVPDLEVYKVSSPDPVVAGTTLHYRVRVANASDAPATNVTLIDRLPAEVTYVGAVSERGACAATDGVVTCPLGTVQERPVFVEITTTVDPLAPSVITNTVQVGGDEPDVDGATNTAIVTTNVAGAVDLAVSKSTIADLVQKNVPFSYTMTIFNAGPSAVTSLTLTDQLDPALVFNAALADQGFCGTAADNEQLVVCDLGTLGVAQTTTVTLFATPVERRVVTNQVTVGSPQQETDPSNNQARVDVEVRGAADLAVTKVATTSSAVAGAPLVYVATVSNAGPDEGFEVVFEDNLPSLVTPGLVTETITASQGTCTLSSRRVRCDLGNLPADEEATIAMTVTVNPEARRSLRNTAEVSGVEFDFNEDNDTVSLNTPVVGQADLGIRLVDSAGPVLAGAPLNYTLVVSNAGPALATDVVVTNTLLAGVNLATATTSQGRCTLEPAEPAGGSVSCNLDDVAVHSTVVISISASVVETATIPIGWAAGVRGREDDLQLANNSSSGSLPVLAQADLALSKTHSAATSVVAGSKLVASISVRNNGPSTARGTTITDTLPAGLTFVSASPGCRDIGSVVVCTVGSLASNASASIMITGTIDPLLRNAVTNTAVVGSSAADPVTTNNTASATTMVVGVADLAVATTATTPDEQVAAGSSLRYTSVISNNGPSAATSVILTNTLPSGVTLVAATTDTDALCDDPRAGEVLCGLGRIAPGEQVIVTIDVTVNGAVRVGDRLINVVTVRGAEADPNLGNGNQTTLGVTIGVNTTPVFLPVVQR